ncbi:MAG TPA: glycosyltransferase [Flavobacterium sp.]|jgi:glycosyltransferase involved in cell wall biosynthesis
MESVRAVRTLKKELTPSKTTSSTTENDTYDMVVFCHLRWEFVYQRPQHIISRMSKEYKILLIEEPVPHEEHEKNTANLIKVSENLHILQPKVDSLTDIKNVIKKYVSNTSIEIGWFYSPSFVPLLSEFSFDKVVYDCMDELSLFKGAPAELLDQEKFLISNAHIIFTGGKSLYDSKKRLHKNVYCFPSSVDQAHFAKAQNGVAIPDDVANLTQPIVGYFGVIDERLDLELLGQTASSHPDITFIMIGPLAKINEADLPQPGNIHYLGMRSYDVLPNYLKAFSIAMMPFALNDATKYISPTKTLEYMAAGKPIISTAIKDVVRDYKHCVTIVENSNEFGTAIQDLLENANDLSMDLAYGEILERTSWDNTADKMKLLITKTAKL